MKMTYKLTKNVLYSTGVYPECICEKSLLYQRDSNQCVGYPEDALGTYPYCECIDKAAKFDADWTKCTKCSLNSEGSIRTFFSFKYLQTNTHNTQ